MKKRVCLILILIFCLLLSGCSGFGERVKDPVTFYYVRSDYQRDMGEVIVSEIREASGHREDLPYLLALYSMGPSSEDMLSLLPRNAQIVPTEHTDKGIVLSLSESAERLDDSDFTLVCACLSMTCMELIEVEQVTIVCGDRTITMNPENLIFNSDISQTQAEEQK